MERDNHISRQKPSGSRGQNRTQNGRNSQREDPIGNKDITNRRIKCPDCDGRLPKEGSKSKSRVWKKVIWFTRRNKSAKNEICQCHTDEGNHSSVEDRHSNSWSFTRRASRKFRISSRKRQCKSESSKKSFQVRGKQDDPCTSHESSQPSTRTGSVCSSGANSPTATGSFCDFGATSHAGGRGSRRHKNTFVLTEIAREINPPVKNDSLPLSDIHPPPKRLSKSSSSVSHLSRRCMSPTSGNVRRSKSFPGSQSCISPSKRRFINTPNTPFGSFSPPLKQKCYGLRRTATFAGKLNTEFPKMCIKKSKSVNTAELTRLEKSTSLGEIRDQSGSIVGVVHFYKSPKKMARRMSSFNRELKKDCTFEEEEFGYETIDQTNSNLISATKEGSRAHLNKNSTISERDISLVARRSSFNETSKRDCEEACKNEITTSCDSPLPLDRTLNIEASLSLSSINEDINDACSSHDEPTLCDNEPGALGVLYNNKSVQELGLDFNDDYNVKNVIGNNYVGNDSDILGVVNNNCVVQETRNASGNSNVNTTDSSYPFGCAASLSSMTIQETVTENVSDIEKIIQNEPGSMKDESLCSTLPSKDETSNISTVSETSALAHDYCISSGSCHENDLFTEQPSTSGTSQQISENVQLLCNPQDCLSDTCRRCAHHHRNQLLTEPPPSLPTSEQISEDVYLPCQHDDHVSNNCNGCGLHHGNHLLTEIATSEQISGNVKLSYDCTGDVSANCNGNVSGNVKLSCDCTGDVSANCNGNHLLTKQMCVLSKPHQSSEISEESEGKNVSNANKQCINDVAKNALNSCAMDMNETCVDHASFLEESEDSFCSDNAYQSNIHTDCDRCLESEISVDGTSFPEINRDSIYSNDACQSNKSSCGDGCLESELKITEQVDGLTDERDLEFCNDTELSHNCPCIMPESDLTLETFDNQINTDSIATPVMSREKFQTRVHSNMLGSSEKKPDSPTKNTKSMNDQIDLKVYKECSTSTNGLWSQNCENLRNVATTVIPNEEFQIRGHSRSLTSPEVLECSGTSDYVSMFDESFSPSQNDVPIHTWKTSESDLKSDEIGLPVPGETFKMRTELMLSWFEEFNDEQRNIILKKILNCCELPQMHLLSVAMENNLHKTCPPNCQDMLVWLPYTVTLKILTYLDP
ncbi:F-box WD repeat-containing 7, partial [Paramuricea clavata]